jgi:hypothetical protein
MKYALSLFLLAALAASLALPQSTAGATVKKKKTGTKKTAVATKKGRSSKPAAVASTWRNRQLAPTPERYKEIEQALADKGYLKSEPDGVWNAESSDALRQFQQDKNLSPTGKISSASLIGLGLGPKPGESQGDKAPGVNEAPPPPAPEN